MIFSTNEDQHDENTNDILDLVYDASDGANFIMRKMNVLFENQ